MATGMPNVEGRLLADSPVIGIDEMQQRVRAWEADDVIHSRGVPIGTLALLPEHTAALEALRAAGPYRYILRARLETETRLTEEQRQLCRLADNAFVHVVLQDMERSGIDRGPGIDMYAGLYRAKRDKERAHVDGEPRSWGNTVARWVVALGSGATDFFEGDLQKSQVLPNGQLRPSRLARLERKNYGLGTVVRFMSHLDVHSAPDDDGPRLFITATSHASRIT